MKENIPDSNIINLSESNKKREEQAEKIINFFDRIDADKIFNNEENKREFIKNLDFEKLEDLLIRINGILRDRPIKERAMEGEKVFLKGFIEDEIPPKHEDKIDLLKKMFEGIKLLNEKNGDFESMALLAGYSINAIHLFSDGNGRTSRLVYSFLLGNFKDLKNSGRLSEILGEKGRLAIDIDPSLIAKEILDIFEKNILESGNENPDQEIGMMTFISQKNKELLQSIISPDLLRVFEGILNDTSFIAPVLLKKINKMDHPEKYKRKFFKENDEISATSTILEKLIPDLKEEDVKEIIDNYWGLKKAYVKTGMDAIIEPEKYKIKDESGKEITIKELFKKRINEKIELYN